MAKNRQGKIDGEMKRELSAIIRELKDSRIHFLTSVVAVHVTPDLKLAKAYISLFGNEEEKVNTLKGLNSAAGFIRREIGNRLKLRATPEFSFLLDDTIEKGAHINEVLKSLSYSETTDDDDDSNDINQ